MQLTRAANLLISLSLALATSRVTYAKDLSPQRWPEALRVQAEKAELAAVLEGFRRASPAQAVALRGTPAVARLGGASTGAATAEVPGIFDFAMGY